MGRNVTRRERLHIRNFDIQLELCSFSPDVTTVNLFAMASSQAMKRRNR